MAGTYISSDPSIDFLVYVPPLNQSPLYIVDRNGRKQLASRDADVVSVWLVF